MTKNLARYDVSKQKIEELKPSKELSDITMVELERINLFKKRIPSLIKNIFPKPRSSRSNSNLNKYLTNDLFYAIRSYLVNIPFSEEFKIAKTYVEGNEDLYEFDLELIHESFNDDEVSKNVEAHSNYIKKINSHDLFSLLKTAAVNLNFNTDYSILINSNNYKSDDAINVKNRFERIDLAINVIANIIESRKQVLKEYNQSLNEELQLVYK